MLGFVFIMFSFSFVFVAGCDDDQTIMRLYRSSNSHVSAWDVNVDSYLEEICYDDIFGHKYEGSNPHKCSDSNRVLSLSASSNAHVSKDHDDDYSYDVCYGDLVCSFDLKGCKDGDSKSIIKVSGYSNAHASSVVSGTDSKWISKGTLSSVWSGKTNAPQDFSDIKAAFLLGGVSPDILDSTSYYINNPSTKLWTKGTLSSVWSGKTNAPQDFTDVKAAWWDASGRYLTVIDSTNYYIYDEKKKIGGEKYAIEVCCSSGGSLTGVYWADMNGKNISSAEFGDTVRLIKVGSGSGIFKIKEHDKLVDDNIRDVNGVKMGGKLVGEWKISREDMEKTKDFDEFYFNFGDEKSSYLNIDTHGKDDPMKIEIISPTCGSYYDQGDKVLIKVNALDNDDVITGILKIDGKRVADFHNGVFELNKTFNVAGNSQIVVEVSNSRGEKARTIANIMILEKSSGRYVDRNYTAACINKPKDLSRISKNVVEFDASTTRAIKVVNGKMMEMIPGKNKFSWYWKFMPENIKREFVDTENKLAYQFTAEFSISGDNSASLRVEI